MSVLSKREKCLNNFLEEHLGVLTLLGLFMVFLGTASNQLFPKIEGVIDFSAGSSFIWLSVMLIVITCLLILINDSLKYNKFSVRLLGGFLLIAFIPILLYFIISFILNKDIMNSIDLFPKSFVVAIAVMAPLFIILLINKIKSSSIKKALHTILIICSVLFIFTRGSLNLISTELYTLHLGIWGAMSFIVSYLFYAYNYYKRKFD